MNALHAPTICCASSACAAPRGPFSKKSRPSNKYTRSDECDAPTGEPHGHVLHVDQVEAYRIAVAIEDIAFRLGYELDLCTAALGAQPEARGFAIHAEGQRATKGGPTLLLGENSSAVETVRGRARHEKAAEP